MVMGISVTKNIKKMFRLVFIGYNVSDSNVPACVHVLMTGQIKTLREKLNAEWPQNMHESSSMLDGSASDFQSMSGPESFPSQGETFSKFSLL